MAATKASARTSDVSESVSAPAQTEPPKAEPDLEEVKQAVKEMNDFIKQASPSIQFSLDEESGRTIVKMVDTETNQVVRQIPTKEALAISKALDSLMGMTLRVKA